MCLFVHCRQHPGQYEYCRNYDDLENHFRKDNFLCEDETCLAKKFIVFQSDTELKAHGIEHLVIPMRGYRYSPSFADIDKATDFIYSE
ncbi:hypothetical protein Dimus_005943 [Dionaea muscipula]